MVTKRITIEYGIDGDTSSAYWACKYEDLMDNTESIDVITGLGMLAASAIDLAQRNGMIPMPSEAD